MKIQKENLCVVTGASAGIGSAIAGRIADSGRPVVGLARDPERLREAEARHTHLTGRPCDLSSDDEIDRATNEILSSGDGLDALVHCAGVYNPGRIGDAPAADFDAMVRVNVRAPYRLTQALLPALARSRGWVIFINSSAGMEARAGVGGFSATQHALRALADALRQEVNDEGIRVLSIYPGRTATPRIQRIFAGESRPYQPELLLQASDVADLVLYALDLPEHAELTDLHVRPSRKSY